ncbi:MAG TPA: hydroxylamine reductase [Candidatus Omnitrophota bacterium]|nr:hydroxylamine reductase [Candidatus Omnitrophota bacterium]HPD84870.1 hydroxylamine reductase [Candidatus Omnitrophota bacterium]HRZ03728.1 hydroxylamine reductase [Candidatus Omnitrophota bacterium]
MMCRQCEQTAKGQGCTVKGVCGKDSNTAILQDLLLHGLKGIAFFGKMARDLGVKEKKADLFLIEGLFTTVTNVNFDPERIAGMIRKSYTVRENLKNSFLKAYKNKNGNDFSDKLPKAAEFKPADSLDNLLGQGLAVGLFSDVNINEDIRSLREILLYGMKGMAAYADHAAVLGVEDEEVNAFFYKGMASLVDDTLTADAYLSLIMEFGKVNLKCLEILDTAHTKHFGNPVPTKVLLGTKKGPAIIVSGHDLDDLKQLLEQTKDAGVNIYTHGEMLPAHGYPELNKYKNLVGHFGTAWQNQKKEFDGIPAVVLMTTNCIQEPVASYKDRIFTTGLVAWPGVGHIELKNGKKDFSKIITKARNLGGFKEDRIEKSILVGFGHQAVLGVADKVIEAVKAGAVKRFFLIGGCDGAKPGRNYFTEFAQKVPKNCIILTLACGKFRFNRLDFGAIGGLPRLLDCGQCNDAYSAIKIASALAGAFKCSVNELPLSFILSWYEQKAVCILLTLLYLGIKNIRLGPSLPAFVSPNVLKILVEKFNIKPISTVDEDLREALAGR